MHLRAGAIGGLALVAFASTGCPQVLSDWSIGGDAAATYDGNSTGASASGSSRSTAESGMSDTGISSGEADTQEASILDVAEEVSIPSSLLQYPWSETTCVFDPRAAETFVNPGCTALPFRCPNGQPWGIDPYLKCSPGITIAGNLTYFCCDIGSLPATGTGPSTFGNSGDAAPPENACQQLYGCCSCISGGAPCWPLGPDCYDPLTSPQRANVVAAAGGDPNTCQAKLSTLQGMGYCTDY